MLKRIFPLLSTLLLLQACSSVPGVIEQAQSVNIGAHQEAPVTVPVKLNFAELLQLAPEAIRARSVQYNLSGAVRLPLIKVPFQRQGGVGVKR